MGAWGTGVFANDIACDVRDGYRELIADGLDDDVATQRILERHQSELGDSASSANVLVALALTQWTIGRLSDEVRSRAVAAIDDGGDLALWQDDDHESRRRQAVLARARERILSPQRAPIRPRKPVARAGPIAPGDVFIYVHDSGRRFVFWVAGATDTTPIVELLDIGEDDLTADQIVERPPRLRLQPLPRGAEYWPVRFALFECHRLPAGRWEVIGHRPITDPKPVHHWRIAHVEPPAGHTRKAQSSLDRRLDPYI